MRILLERILLSGLLLAGAGALARAQEPDDLFRRGLSLMNASRPLEAEQLFGSVLESDPRYAAAHVLRGYLRLQRGGAAEAEEDFLRALELDETIAAARLGLGIALSRRGDSRAAANQFEEILADPNLGVKARVQWLQSQFLLGRADDAFREARSLVSRFPRVARYHATLGFLHQTRGEFRAALEAYGRAVEIEPDDLSTHFSLIGLQRLAGNWSEVLHWSERALELDPNHPILHLERSRALERLGREADAREAREWSQRTFDAEVAYTGAAKALAAGRTREAEADLRRCLDLNPGLSKGWLNLGEIEQQRGRHEDALHCFRMALETDPGSAPAHLGIATALHAMGKHDEAVQAYERAIGRGLASPDLHARAAGVYLDQGKARQAARVMLEAVRSLPDNPDLLSYLGSLYEAEGDSGEALETYLSALRFQPDQVQALVGKGFSLLARGDAAGAASSFRRATRLAPSNVQTWHGLIQAHLAEGLRAEAGAACRDCLQQSPADLTCREQAARLQMEAGEFREAAANYQVVLRHGKASKSILDNLAFALMKDGNAAEATILFESSLEQFGEDGWIHANLGYIHRLRGDLDGAIRAYRRARQLSPRDPDAAHELGFALYLAGKHAEAREHLQAALRHRPDWGLAHYNLAMTYWNLGQHGMALAHAREALERGVRDARPVVQALMSQLSLDQRHAQPTRPR